jgi:hypothetical protein
MSFHLSLNCRQTTALVLSGQDRDLVWHERVAVRIHWGLCGGCRRFGRQAALMKQAMARWRAYREADPLDDPAAGSP